MKINWEEELLKNGFEPLEKYNRIYGNGIMTGRIKYWDSKHAKLIQLERDAYNDNGEFKSRFIVEVFVPFLFEENNPSIIYNSVVLFSIEDLQQYLTTKE